MNGTREDIKNSLKIDLDSYKSELQALLNIKRVHKKDGKDYKNLSKNFTNCVIISDEFSGGNVIRYTYKTNKTGHQIGKIYAYDKLENMPNDGIERETLTSRMMLNDIYQFSIDEIENAINNKIESIKKDIIDIEYALEVSDNAFDKFDKMINNINKELKCVTPRFLQSYLIDYIKSNISTITKTY